MKKVKNYLLNRKNLNIQCKKAKLLVIDWFFNCNKDSMFFNKELFDFVYFMTIVNTKVFIIKFIHTYIMTNILRAMNA